MAFLLGVALLRELRSRGRFVGDTAEPGIMDLLDLVALGTVADVARLKTLNRAFVTQGLKVMAGAAEYRAGGARRGGAAGQAAELPRPRLRARARGSTPAAASASPTSACAC